ncbi:MAG: hydrogenase iron-sulfur subunit, partial [Candidatus Thermoplasmatota archaeon]|nr:hydrogenase iron-sulfur subunit [Candidatus Thermoplasmatota archaeon]
MVFEPKIIAFCCNWCAYAGADLAGTSRIKYPPNVYIVRVMCSGRIEPAHILRALELGADGVLVAGCHPGDCHYISGNEKAEEKVKAVKKITELAGLKSERVRMEWISASEGKKFASVVQNFVDYLKTLGPNPIKLEKYYESKIIDIETLIKNTKAYYCLECGKCTSACQITKYYPGFSPRMIIEKALEELDKEIYSDKYLWQCTTCNLCGVKCPSEVQYVEFIKGARTKARKLGESGRCSKAGAMLSLMR